MWNATGRFDRFFLVKVDSLNSLNDILFKEDFFKETVPENGAVPGAVIAIQTFGDFLGFNPHLHVLCFPRCAGLLWRRHVQGSPSLYHKDPGRDLQAQGLQDAPLKGKNHGRPG